MNKNLAYTKKEYNHESNIKRYTEAIDEIGLWKSEKIIFNKYINFNDKILDQTTPNMIQSIKGVIARNPLITLGI